MSPEKSVGNRREYPRLTGNIPVKLCSGGVDIVTETSNVSRSGAYCRVNKYIEPMTKLTVCLLLPFRRSGKIITKKVCCSGVIVRTEPVQKNAFNTAIYFSDIRNKDAECISEYVAEGLGDHAGHRG